MNFARMMDVLEICVPVFAVMGLGKILSTKGRLTEDHCKFINWLVYHFSLPALILNGVAGQRMNTFADPAVTLVPVLALVIVVILTMAVARFNRYKGGFAAAVVFGTFWANVSYVGFPLCQNAFGDAGFAKAAIYNGLLIPVFIIFGYLLIGFYGAGSGKVNIAARIRGAFLNPILLACLAGVVVAFIIEPFRADDGAVHMAPAVLSAGKLLSALMKMVGTMGLPLALLAIGASLKWEQTRSHLGALGWTVGCKLLLLPLITLLLIQWLCRGASAVSFGVPVILAGAPCAVASYVVSCQLGVERGFVSSMLVLSTTLSIITIPFWVYIVKGLV